MNHTFVIPAYNRPKYLAECIRSLQNQNMKIPIIISTSTPNDYVRRIAKKYSVTLIEHNQGGSIAKDWNYAYKIADAKYVTLAHEDDIYLPNYSEAIKYHCLRYDPLLISTKYLDYVDDMPRRTYAHIIKNFMNSVFYYRKKIGSTFWKNFSLMFGNSICCPSVTYNKEMIGDFKFSNKYKVNLDWDAWARLSKFSGSFLYVNRVLMYHRIHSNAQTNIGIHDSTRYLEDKEMFEYFWPVPIARLLSFFYKYSYTSSTSDH
ncbi:glycosyltransferase family 2 protein [Candidatus Dojkabacteria bacterium]|nr:glycosyltransferase family 2 protein [Candidatus Dojkabacteria bacterium]